jgi:hypothetical protein
MSSKPRRQSDTWKRYKAGNAQIESYAVKFLGISGNALIDRSQEYRFGLYEDLSADPHTIDDNEISVTISDPPEGDGR